MPNDHPADLQKQLEVERARVKQLESEREELQLKIHTLENEKTHFKPLADAWLREHLPSKEECEKMLKEMLAHPEGLLDFNVVVQEMLEEFNEQQRGENAA
jgi:hypothetical protein